MPERAPHERRVYPERTKAAIALVFFLAMASADAMLRSAPTVGLDVADFERRLAPLREALPRRGGVEYVSDTDFVGELFMTQYVLAPVVVYPPGYPAPASAQVLVVGIFETPANVPDALARKGLVVKRDFGEGVLLLEPKAR